MGGGQEAPWFLKKKIENQKNNSWNLDGKVVEMKLLKDLTHYVDSDRF